MGQIGRSTLLYELPIGVIVASRWCSGISSGAQSSTRRFKAVGDNIARARPFSRSSFLVIQKFKKDQIVGVGRSLRDVAV